MPAYTQTTTQIIQSAYRIIGTNTPNNSPTPSQIEIGIEQLNMCLSSLEVGDMGVAFYDQITFNLVNGQSRYEFSLANTADVESKPFSSLEWIVYIQNNSRIRIKPQSRQEFYNSPKSTQNFGVPKFVVLDQQQNKSFLEFWPIPNSNYTINLSAKLLFDECQIDEILLDMPANYYEYLQMRLALKLSFEFPATSVWKPEHQALLTQLAGDIKAKNITDVSVNMTRMFTSNGQFYSYTGVGGPS